MWIDTAEDVYMYIAMLETMVDTRPLACSAVVCVDAGETILVSFWVGKEGWTSKYTRSLVGLFLLWISEL